MHYELITKQNTEKQQNSESIQAQQDTFVKAFTKKRKDHAIMMGRLKNNWKHNIRNNRSDLFDREKDRQNAQKYFIIFYEESDCVTKHLYENSTRLIDLKISDKDQKTEKQSQLLLRKINRRQAIFYSMCLGCRQFFIADEFRSQQTFVIKKFDICINSLVRQVRIGVNSLINIGGGFLIFDKSLSKTVQGIQMTYQNKCQILHLVEETCQKSINKDIAMFFIDLPQVKQKIREDEDDIETINTTNRRHYLIRIYIRIINFKLCPTTLDKNQQMIKYYANKTPTTFGEINLVHIYEITQKISKHKLTPKHYCKNYHITYPKIKEILNKSKDYIKEICQNDEPNIKFPHNLLVFIKSSHKEVQTISYIRQVLDENMHKYCLSLPYTVYANPKARIYVLSHSQKFDHIYQLFLNQQKEKQKWKNFFLVNTSLVLHIKTPMIQLLQQFRIYSLKFSTIFQRKIKSYQSVNGIFLEFKHIKQAIFSFIFINNYKVKAQFCKSKDIVKF